MLKGMIKIEEQWGLRWKEETRSLLEDLAEHAEKRRPKWVFTVLKREEMWRLLEDLGDHLMMEDQGGKQKR